MNCAQKLTHQNEGNERIIVKEFQLIKAKHRERERARERERMDFGGRLNPLGEVKYAARKGECQVETAGVVGSHF